MDKHILIFMFDQGILPVQPFYNQALTMLKVLRDYGK